MDLPAGTLKDNASHINSTVKEAEQN